MVILHLVYFSDRNIDGLLSNCQSAKINLLPKFPAIRYVAHDGVCWHKVSDIVNYVKFKGQLSDSGKCT